MSPPVVKTLFRKFGAPLRFTVRGRVGEYAAAWFEAEVLRAKTQTFQEWTQAANIDPNTCLPRQKQPKDLSKDGCRRLLAIQSNGSGTYRQEDLMDARYGMQITIWIFRDGKSHLSKSHLDPDKSACFSAIYEIPPKCRGSKLADRLYLRNAR